ncbi:MAG: hypothetical protein ABMB14_25095 [Myxococcota bacterium]
MRSLVSLFVLPLLLTACPADDVTDEGGSDTGSTATDPADAIAGDWVSEGDDISPLFQSAFFSYTRIDATFGADGSYTVTSVDANGASYDFAGTYAVTTDTDPRGIVLEQATPSTATAEGIWQVDVDGVLSYEVVQTTPDIGFAAPTPDGGFGSTSGPGLAAGDNVQVFRRP